MGVATFKRLDSTSHALRYLLSALLRDATRSVEEVLLFALELFLQSILAVESLLQVICQSVNIFLRILVILQTVFIIRILVIVCLLPFKFLILLFQLCLHVDNLLMQFLQLRLQFLIPFIISGKGNIIQVNEGFVVYIYMFVADLNSLAAQLVLLVQLKLKQELQFHCVYSLELTEEMAAVSTLIIPDEFLQLIGHVITIGILEEHIYLLRSHLVLMALIGYVQLFASITAELPPEHYQADVAIFQDLVIFILLTLITHGCIKILPSF